jgi:hypothetical protein
VKARGRGQLAASDLPHDRGGYARAEVSFTRVRGIDDPQ